MKKARTVTLLVLMTILSCEEFLDLKPIGTVPLSALSSSEEGAESLLISAYSVLDGYINGALSDLPSAAYYAAAASNWVFGSIAGGDAYKGSTSDDQKDITAIETENVLPTNEYPEGKWRVYYEGINRANIAIRAFKGLSQPLSSKHLERLAEARFLRGFYHYELWKIFHNIPYISDTIQEVRVGNKANVLPEIQKDFAFAAEHLPLSQPDEPGRVTTGAAKSYLGITWMWDKQWLKAKELFDEVIKSGQYELNPKYHDTFNPAIRNVPKSILDRESVLVAQLSVTDGANGGNANFGDVLNYPNGSTSPTGCCGFHQPSQNLVNAFKTDSNGLPLLDNYNDEDVTNDDGKLSSDQSFTPHSGFLDPRLDWTVGRRGIPFIDWGPHPGETWIRNQVYGGPYSPIKNVISKSQIGAYNDSWVNLNSNNIKLLRYADLLLYAAEAELELGNLNTALGYVNKVRERAANPEGFVMDGQVPAANYKIEIYPNFPSQEYARKAVRFERRIELGMEGHRFFDLVRWGIAAKEKNDYFAVESKKRNHLVGAEFKENKHEYMPIPQRAIDLSSLNGIQTLEQNPGY